MARSAIRNKQLLEEGKPDLVLALKNGSDHALSCGGPRRWSSK